MGPSVTAAILWRERRMEGGGGRNRGRSIVAPSSSQVNIDTAWADTVPEALINHFQWTHTNTLTHTQAQAERKTTHIVTQCTHSKSSVSLNYLKYGKEKKYVFINARHTHACQLPLLVLL